MSENIETLVVGAGQAGLALSYSLKQRGRPHVVLERAPYVASAWRDGRWDSFTLVSPNWAIRLPGAHYTGPEPDGFMGRAEFIAYLDDYARGASLPIQTNTRVLAVTQAPAGGYHVATDQGDWHAHNVVIATGLFQQPQRPAWAASLPAALAQLHSSEYRRPQALAPGAVLVVGSGQSGVQIAQELLEAGRAVYLSLGSAGRAPRRYRGRDVYAWLDEMGFFRRTPAVLPSPQARFASAPQLSGRHGGQDINLHLLARDGARLLGRAVGVEDGRLRFAPDLHERLAAADQFETNIVKAIDDYVTRSGHAPPPDPRPVLKDGFDQAPRTELHPAEAGLSTVIWANGYTWDYSLVQLPVFEPNGYPLQTRGVTEYPGLYFLGMPFIQNHGSGQLVGVGEDAEYLAELIAARAS